MLPTRSIVTLITFTIVLGLVVSVLGLRREPDSGGVGRDTYGLRAHGYRGVLELLNELDVEARRQIAPPSGDHATDVTVALLTPSPPIVALEPVYLDKLVGWVEAGGRLVVAPPTAETYDRFQASRPQGDEGFPKADLLTVLGLADVRVSGDRRASSRRTPEDDAFSWESTRWRESRAQRPTQRRESRFRIGAGEGWLTFALPDDARLHLNTAEHESRAIIRWSDAIDSDDGVFAAAFPKGEGEIVVVADPDLFSNALLDQADNAIAAVRLLSPDGNGVVFDEHYHGLSVRGNALYLLTRPGFVAVTLAVLGAAGVWAWRTSVPLGPPVPTPPRPRRDLREYLQAMGRLLLRGRDGRRFLLAELRQGTLEELGRQHGLASLTPQPERVAAALARRDRQRAERFTSAIDAIDTALAEPRRPRKAEAVQLMKGASSCL